MKHVRIAEPSHIVLALSPKKISRILWMATALIVAAGAVREAVGQETILGRLDYLALFDSPSGIVNWFQSSVLLVAALLLMVVTRRSYGPNTNHWALLSGLFLLLSADEAVNIHGLVLTPLRGSGEPGVVTARWGPLVLTLAIGIYLAPMLRRLPSRFALKFALWGMIFVGGAIVMEAISNHLIWENGANSTYRMGAFAEETLETVGAVGFVQTLLQWLFLSPSGIRIRSDAFMNQ